MSRILSLLGGMFTPTGAVLVPMFCLLAVLVTPSLGNILGKFGYETKSVLRGKIETLIEDKQNLEASISSLELRIKDLTDTINKQEEINKRLEKKTAEREKKKEDLMSKVNDSSSTPEEGYIEKDLSERDKVSMNNINVLHEAFDTFFPKEGNEV